MHSKDKLIDEIKDALYRIDPKCKSKEAFFKSVRPVSGRGRFTGLFWWCVTIDDNLLKDKYKDYNRILLMPYRATPSDFKAVNIGIEKSIPHLDESTGNIHVDFASEDWLQKYGSDARHCIMQAVLASSLNSHIGPKLNEHHNKGLYEENEFIPYKSNAKVPKACYYPRLDDDKPYNLCIHDILKGLLENLINPKDSRGAQILKALKYPSSFSGFDAPAIGQTLPKGPELPYNLDFIVRNKRAQIKCPYCGSKDTARILYGMPDFSDELKEKMDSGKVVLGGCRIFEAEINGQRFFNMPSMHCNSCRKEFGTPPLLINRDKAEDLREIVESIEFCYGAYLSGETTVTIKKNEKGARVSVSEFPYGTEPPNDKQITPIRWTRLIDKLFNELHLHEWKKHYSPDGDWIMDGDYWHLKIKLSGKRVRIWSGENAYPVYWNKLRALFKSLR